MAPKLLGGDGISALGALGLHALSDARALEDLRVRRVGSDVHVFGRVARPAGSASGR